jgi:hypothetical protein
MMTENRQILKPFGIVATKALEGDGYLAVHFAASFQEQIVIDHVLQQ